MILYRLLNFNRIPLLPDYPQQYMPKDRDNALIRRLKCESLPLPALSNLQPEQIIFVNQVLKILKEKVQCCNVSADCPTSKRIQGAYVKDKVSAKKLTDTFYIGNKSYDIVDKLCNMNIVSEQLHSHFKAELVAASEQFAMPVGKRVMHDRPQAHL